jgi:hypothetical protein
MAKTPTDIRSLARSHTESALNVLAGVMNEASAPAAARVSAATALLNRGWGMPEQKIESDVAVSYVARLPNKTNSTEEWQKQTQSLFGNPDPSPSTH